MPLERTFKTERSRLYLSAFFIDVVGHGYSLLVSAHAQRDLGASPGELGLLGTVTTVAYAAVCLTAGGSSDRRGSRPLMAASLTFIAVLVLPVALLSNSTGILYAANAAMGACLAFFWPPVFRELSFLSPGKLLWRSLGAFNLAWAVGAVVGTWGAPKLFAQIGFPRAGSVLVVFTLLGLVSLAWRRAPVPAAPPRVPSEAAGAVPREGDPLPSADERAQVFLRLAWVANFCASFAMNGLHAVFIYVTSSLGLELGGWAVLILTGKEIGRLAGFGLCRWFSGWHYSFAWLAALQLAGGGALVLAGFVTEPAALFLLFVVLGLSSGLAYYSSIFYALSLRSEEGKQSGLHEGILATGAFLGPLALGVAGEVSATWTGAVPCTAGAVILLGLALEVRLKNLAGRRRRARDPVE